MKAWCLEGGQIQCPTGWPSWLVGDFWSGGRGRDLILLCICKNKAEVALDRVQQIRASPMKSLIPLVPSLCLGARTQAGKVPRTRKEG